jgi:hypothetical protein
LNYPDDFVFDAVVYDFHYGPCLLPLLQRFKFPPLIAVSAFNVPSLRRGLVGGHLYSGYGEFLRFLIFKFLNRYFSVPFFTTRKVINLNFWDRLYNFFLYHFEIL